MTAAPPAVRSGREMLAPLRSGQFRLQFAAQAISVAGSALSPVALALGVLAMAGSARALSLVLAASSLPLVLFLLVGGVLADRLPRHRLMVAANLVCALAQLALGFMMVSGRFSLAWAVVLQFVAGTALAFYFPSVSGLTAELVPGPDLQKANALLSLTRSVAGSVGPLVAGGLVLEVGAGWALVFDGLTFVAGAACLARIRVPVPGPSAVAGGGSDFRSDLREGFGEVMRRTWVWTSIGAFMLSHLATAFFLVLAPAELLRRGYSPVAWGAVIAVLSVGQLLGDVLALRFTPRRPILASRLVELLSVPVLVGLAVAAPLPFLLAGAFVGGVALTFPDALWYTALQQHLAVDVQSRVSSYDWLGSLALRPVGFLAASALAGWIGAPSTLLLAAVLLVLSRLAGLLSAEVRSLRFLSDVGEVPA